MRENGTLPNMEEEDEEDEKERVKRQTTGKFIHSVLNVDHRNSVCFQN
jgi:hypothetical protein